MPNSPRHGARASARHLHGQHPRTPPSPRHRSACRQGWPERETSTRCETEGCEVRSYRVFLDDEVELRHRCCRRRVAQTPGAAGDRASAPPIARAVFDQARCTGLSPAARSRTAAICPRDVGFGGTITGRHARVS
jgi:hypothetical protein